MFVAVLQSSSDTASLKETISSLREEITALQHEKENHLSQITSLTEALEQQKSDLAVKEAHSLHLENQLRGMYSSFTLVKKMGEILVVMYEV